jgi:hypothetical protein
VYQLYPVAPVPFTSIVEMELKSSQNTSVLNPATRAAEGTTASESQFDTGLLFTTMLKFAVPWPNELLAVNNAVYCPILLELPETNPVEVLIARPEGRPVAP